jgi:hypothetical protein
MFMKQLLFCLSFIIYLSFSPIGALAQTGLHVDELFQGRIIPQERMIETRVRGKTLEKYRLTYYRSLRMTVSHDESRQLGLLLDKDKETSIDMRSYRENPHSWKTYTCKMQLPSSGGKNRFLCYQEQWNRHHDQCEVTVIYMEGTVESLKQLEELLK